MPRANRHYLPSYLWNITHRCHEREFLLKFAQDQHGAIILEKWKHSIEESRSFVSP
jgi:hypothetical protein